MKEYYFGRGRWYDADEVDKILAELRENQKKQLKGIPRTGTDFA